MYVFGRRLFVSLCAHFVVAHRDFGRAPESIIPCWRGYIPDSIGNLTELVVFRAWYYGGNFSYIAPALFSLPKIEELELHIMGARIFWPPQGISSTLVNLFVGARGLFAPNLC